MSAKTRTKSLAAHIIAIALAGAAFSPGAWAEGTLEAALASGVIRLGHWPGEVPFSDLDGQGQPVGYSIDLCKRIMDLIEAKAGKPLRREWVAIQSDTRFTFLDQNKIDLACADITNTRGRQEKYAFSHTVFVAGIRTMAKTSSGLRSWNDLKGKRVAVVAKTTGEDLIRDLDKRSTLHIQFVAAESLVKAWELLERGEADAVCYDDVLLSELASKSPLGADAFAFFDRYLSVEPYGLMLRKNDPVFLTAVNDGLEALFSSGEIHQIYAKWFVNGERKVPMSSFLREDIAQPNSYPAFP